MLIEPRVIRLDAAARLEGTDFWGALSRKTIPQRYRVPVVDAAAVLPRRCGDSVAAYPLTELQTACNTCPQETPRL